MAASQCMREIEDRFFTTKNLIIFEAEEVPNENEPSGIIIINNKYIIQIPNFLKTLNPTIEVDKLKLIRIGKFSQAAPSPSRIKCVFPSDTMAMKTFQ